MFRALPGISHWPDGLVPHARPEHPQNLNGVLERERHMPGHGENQDSAISVNFGMCFAPLSFASARCTSIEEGVQLSFGIKTGNPEKVRGCFEVGYGRV